MEVVAHQDCSSLEAWLSEELPKLGYTLVHDWTDAEHFIWGEKCVLEKGGKQYYFFYSLREEFKIYFGFDAEDHRVFRHTIQWSGSWKETISTEILSLMP